MRIEKAAERKKEISQLYLKTIQETNGGIRKEPTLIPVIATPLARALSVKGNQLATARALAGNIGPWQRPKRNRRTIKALRMLTPVNREILPIAPVRNVKSPHDRVAHPRTCLAPKRSASMPPGT